MISEEGVWTLNSEEEEAYRTMLEEEADRMISDKEEEEACKMIPDDLLPCRIISEEEERNIISKEEEELMDYPPELIRKPWILNVLLSENQVPIKAKARVTVLSRQKNRDGTHSGEITDYVHRVNVVFSEEAVVECLEDMAHGHIFRHITAIIGGAIVLTDYEVVPRFSDWEFVLLVNHFKVLPGFIGSLAYKEAIPGDIMESKHLKEVKEKLQYLWERQNGAPNCRFADTPPVMSKDCFKSPVIAEDLSQEDEKAIIDASTGNVQCEMNSQHERGSLSLIVDMADQVSKEQREKDDMLELCRQYEPLENTDRLSVHDLLDRIHLAHTKYAPVGLQSLWETCQSIDIPSLNLSHSQTARPNLSHQEMGSECGSLDLKLVQMTKACLVELCQKYKPLENADVLEIPDLLEILNQAHIRYAPIPYSQASTLNARHGDVIDSQRESSPSIVSPHGLVEDDNLGFNFTLSDRSQSCPKDCSQLSLSRRSGLASLKPVTSNTTSITCLTDIRVLPHILNDKKGCDSSPCSSKNLIDRILNTTVSPKCANVVRPAMRLSSQTTRKPEERQKRMNELWDFIDTYWKYKEKNKNRANKR